MITIAALVVWMAVAPTPAQPPMSDCSTCHEEAAKAFASGPHGRAMAGAGSELLSRSCATCHEPKPEHLEAPAKENVTRVPREAACLSCHAVAAGELTAAAQAHHRGRVGCLDCHASGHAAAAQPSLLKGGAQQVCGACHAAQRAGFQKPFAHREGREGMACTECHSAHGRNRNARVSALQRSGECLACHSEVAGPHVFEHAAQSVSGCAACHETHGSANPRMLKRRDVASLCLECHSNVPQFHDITQTKFRACVSCHGAVHGSNRDAHLLDD